MARILSGIQPSGLSHLGNFFGAIEQHLALQDEGEAFYFIADYHALTTLRDAAKLREYVREVAVTYLALGFDPDRATLWRQSDVPEVQEITWLLSTVTGMGLLERAHSYKDKVANGIKPSVGLFTYPALMAADILCFDSERVPVGKDQVQHIEMAQDMGGSFNAAFGEEVFKRPEWSLSPHPKVLGCDGQKMSKSYDNYLWIFEEGKPLKKAIDRITTDSRRPEEPKDPDELLLFDWLRLFLDAEEREDLAQKIRNGGDGAPGYGDLKKRLRAAIEERFGAAREERRRLLADPAHVDGVLARGAQHAGEVARGVRDRAYRACGLR